MGESTVDHLANRLQHARLDIIRHSLLSLYDLLLTFSFKF